MARKIENAGTSARGEMKEVRKVADLSSKSEVMGGRGSMPKEVGHKAGGDMGAVPGAANAGGRGSNRMGDMGYYGEARGEEINQSPAGGKDYDDERE
jgi:hypothetical protein